RRYSGPRRTRATRRRGAQVDLAALGSQLGARRRRILVDELDLAVAALFLLAQSFQLVIGHQAHIAVAAGLGSRGQAAFLFAGMRAAAQILMADADVLLVEVERKVKHLGAPLGSRRARAGGGRRRRCGRLANDQLGVAADAPLPGQLLYIL